MLTILHFRLLLLLPTATTITQDNISQQAKTIWHDHWPVFTDSDTDLCRLAWHLSALYTELQLLREKYALIRGFMRDICLWQSGLLLDYLIAEETIDCRGLPAGGFLHMLMDWLRFLISNNNNINADSDEFRKMFCELLDTIQRLERGKLFPYRSAPLQQLLNRAISVLQQR
jgi:hypothetical protein